MSNDLFPSNIKGLTPQVLKTAEFKTASQESPNGYTFSIAQTRNPIWHFDLIYDYLYDTYFSAQNVMPNAPYTDLQTLMGFFLAHQGKFDDFLFLDPRDYCAAGMRSGVWRPNASYTAGSVIIDRNGHAQRVSASGVAGTAFPAFSTSGGTTSDGGLNWFDEGYFPLGWPNERVTLQVLTDGNGHWYSPLQRTVGPSFQEDVTDLVPGSLSVYANGVYQNAGAGQNYTLAGPGLALPGKSFMGLYLVWNGQPAAPVTANFNFYFRVKFEEDTQDFETWCRGLWTIGGSTSKNGSGYLKLKSSRVPQQ